MIVLALETCTPAGSAALARDGQLVEGVAGEAERPHAARLPGDLVGLLARHDLTLAEIDVFAVCLGPGAMTGLRIGIATVQGLAFATGKPVVGVGALEALASAAPASCPVVVLIDAARGEVFGAAFGPAAGATGDRPMVGPLVAPPAEALARLAPAPDAWLVGDGVLRYRAIVATAVPGATLVEPTPLVAPLVAAVASQVAARGGAGTPHALRPIYVRRPDAELARDRSSGEAGLGRPRP